MGSVATEISRVDSGHYSRHEVAALASGARQVAAAHGSIIRQYAGDVPFGLACVRSWHESSGKTTTRTSSGEIGLLQVWMGPDWEPGLSAQPGRPGRACQLARGCFDPYDASQNLWCGLRFWNNVARRVYGANPRLYPAPDAQFWGAVNIALNLGEGALNALLRAAAPRPGLVMSDLDAWVRSVSDGLSNAGIPGVGSAATARRVITTPRWIAAAAQLGGLSSGGFGVVNIGVEGVPYTGGAGSTSLLGLAFAGAGLWLAWRAR